MHKMKQPASSTRLALENLQPLQYALATESDHHHRCFLHALRPLMSLTYIQGGEIQDRGFFVDRTAVGKNRLGRQLQLIVVLETQRLEQAHIGMKPDAHCLYTLHRSRMRGNNYGKVILFRNFIQGLDQRKEVAFRVDIFFSMRTHHKEFIFLQAQPRQHIRALNTIPIVVQNLKHRTTGFDNHIGGQTFPQQVVPSDGAISEIDICGVIDNSSIYLFGNAHIKAPIARFHMESWDLSTLGG
ncbi:hypothetical protein PAERUG_P48_London_17_VIM_2_01_13_02386 [Pseudomonas aeruginosa]|nr:hypothetical protein PAERUG_P48_London_17_VIM_2_01_13_02386 [Pseudomonas aeruginosa]